MLCIVFAQIDRKRKSYFESSGLFSSGSGASVTIKGESTGSSSAGAVVTGTKTFSELTEEEKRRFIEIQKKDEEESKSQWGDGSYEQSIRYQNSNKQESTGTVMTGGASHNGHKQGGSGASMQVTDVNRGSKSMTVVTSGGQHGNEASGNSVVTNANRGPTFSVQTSGGVVREQYDSKSTSGGSGSGSVSTSNAQGNRWSQSGEAESDTHYGSSSSGAYGAAHFDESSSSSGSSTFHMEASSSSSGGGTTRFETAGTAGSRGAVSEAARGQSSSSVTVVQSGGSEMIGGSEVSGESEMSGGSEVSGGWSSSGQSSVTSHAVDGWDTSRAAAESQGEKWSRDNGIDGQWNQSGGGGGWHQGGKNYTSFRESEKSHVANTTWDDSGGIPKTYVTDKWRTNDDGMIRNGSSSHVVDGGALDGYRDAAVRRMHVAAGGVTNVIGGTTGDDSDLSVTMTGAERQNQGFRQTKVEESETVNRWRTEDGKLYRANAAGNWDTLRKTSEGGASTEVYEAQDLAPQNYVKPTDVNGKFKLYTRFRRDTQTKRCGPTRCVTVKCKIGPLSKDQEVWLSFRSRAWVSTLKKV